MLRWLSFKRELRFRRIGFLCLVLVGVLTFIKVFYISNNHTEHIENKDNDNKNNNNINNDNNDIDAQTKQKVNGVFSVDEVDDRFKQDDFEIMSPLKDSQIYFGDKLVGIASYSKPQNNVTEAPSTYQRENATFFSLVRNSDFQGIVKAIESVEYRFNNRYHYDWVFANDEPFHPTFIKVIQNLVSGTAHFVEIPKDFWTYPPWIDQKKANDTRAVMKENKVKYGDSESYRHMCRFNSGFFYRLPIMANYRYYWRVEPDIEYRCDMFHEDWFKYMRQNNKKYAFTLAPLELHTTVERLWETVKEFAHRYPHLVANGNNMAFLSEDGGETYNMCHFWSNFEIGDMDFYRLKLYSALFEYIDKAGGFYYSRWGDAPVHSMAVSLLLSKEELLFMDNTGYFHAPNGDCPWDPTIRRERRCACMTKNEATWLQGSCIPKWFEIHGVEKPDFVPKFKFVNQHKVEEEEKENEDVNDDKDD